MKQILHNQETKEKMKYQRDNFKIICEIDREHLFIDQTIALLYQQLKPIHQTMQNAVNQPITNTLIVAQD